MAGFPFCGDVLYRMAMCPMIGPDFPTDFKIPLSLEKLEQAQRHTHTHTHTHIHTHTGAFSLWQNAVTVTLDSQDLGANRNSRVLVTVLIGF